MSTTKKKLDLGFNSALKKKELGYELNIRDHSAIQTENKILEYLKVQSDPVSFYKLYTDLKFTSGKAQSALNRLAEDGYVTLKRKVDKFKTFVWYDDFKLENEVLELEDENLIIFPVGINYVLGSILNQVPEVSDEYGNFIELVQKALIMYFQQEISPEVKRKAVYKAVEKRIISEEIAKQLLGG
ncbi:MAG: hypothetical protein ACTSR8_10005 [Promethearchaeota archaeon]